MLAVTVLLLLLLVLAAAPTIGVVAVLVHSEEEDDDDVGYHCNDIRHDSNSVGVSNRCCGHDRTGNSTVRTLFPSAMTKSQQYSDTHRSLLLLLLI